jgi:tetratricopeptide (TPR) repeat protein/transglutaminase-like putative cysteine protease
MHSVFWTRCVAACLGLSILLAGNGAWAADDVRRGPAPAWVVVSDETATATDAPAEDGMRILLYDNQVRADGEGVATYVRLRSQALSPQALPLLGNVAVSWSPASQEVTVHHVTIIRDGQVLDALDGQTFETLRREQNLEQAMLDGLMTALLPLSGLRVGDILDVAYTTTSRDPVTAGHFEQALDLNLPVAIDRVRYRASWPASLPVRLTAAGGWTPLVVRRVGDQSVVEVELDHVQPIIVPDDAPTRFHAVRLIELTDYRDWSDIAASLKPLYDSARRLAPDSPLQAEIERIRALSEDPAVRAAAALRLVQDQVRYVALIMGAGALTPATADETWNRRFGDCKAKTALLLALLDGLGIEAQPASVSSLNGDGMDQRLPRISAFDHVLVRAVVGDRVYWLDGAQTGDRRLEDVEVPPFHWALPLTGPQARLEALTVMPRAVPDTETRIALDASGGLYAPAAVEGTMTLRGRAAALLGGQMALITGAQKDQGLRAIWSGQLSNPTITEVASTYDIEANVLSLTMKGSVVLDWRPEGLVPPGSLYGAMTTEERPEGPFRNAPYALPHPVFNRQLSTLRPPAGGQGFRVSGGVVDRTELGRRAVRSVSLAGDLVTVEVTVQSLTDEITAEEADRTRVEAAARPYDPPRVFAPADYRPSGEDRTAWDADRPTTAGAWLDRAYALSQAGDPAGALEAANEAVILEPENSTALANRGVYRFWTGDREGAAADLEKAVDIDPSERIAMNGHALLAMARGDHEEAVIELSRALRQAPGDDFALRTRAQAYAALEQYDRALRDIDALITAQPTNTALKLMRIGVLETAGREAEADAAIEGLAEADPSSRLIRLNQAALRLARGDAEGAWTILTDILARAADIETTDTEDVAVEVDASVLTLRAEAAIALGRISEAAQDLATVREANPENPVILNNLCWTAGKAGVLLDQALRDCDAALAIAPESFTILDSRGRVLLQQGDAAAALAAYEAALAKKPDLPASLYGRGLARIALGRTEEGEADKAAAVAISPEVVKSFASYPPAETGPTP